MISSIVDDKIQSGNWATHVPNDGSQIGGAMPSEYIMSYPAPGSASERLFLVRGDKYATFEGYEQGGQSIPSMPFVTMSFSLKVDPAIVTAQILETDLILTDGAGFKYNGSMQLNIIEGWMLQVAKADGNWIDTGIKVPPLDPAKVHQVSMKYQWDTNAHTISPLIYTLNGAAYAIPAALQKVPASASTWAKLLAMMQVQETLAANGGQYGVSIDNAQRVWTNS